MNNERKSRWKSVVRGARRIAGLSGKGDRGLGLGDDDARVNNEHPEVEFAVNLTVEMKHLLALRTRDEILDYVIGKDDHGNPVDTIPVSRTSSAIWLDFSDAMIDLPSEGTDEPLAKFVTGMAYALSEGLNGGQVVPHFPEFRTITNFRLVRIVWMKSLSAWYPQFEET